MEDEAKKRRYRNLYYSVSNIYYEVNNLCNDIGILQKYLSENFTINNQIIEENRINSVKQQATNIKNELGGTVLPSIRWKMY